MRFTGELKILVGSSLFSFIPIAVLYGNELGAFGLLFGRLLVAAVVLFFTIKNKRDLFVLSRRTFSLLALWSMIMFGAMYCYFLAINQSSISISSALLGTQPALVVILAAIMLKEKIKGMHIVTVGITLLGIFLITGMNLSLDTKFISGEILAIVSSGLLALNFIFQKKYLTQFRGKDLVFFQSLFQLPMILPFLFVNVGSLGMHSLIAILILGIVCTTLAYSLIYAGVKEVHPHKIGVLQSFEYVLPVFIGILLYHEHVSPSAFVGITLVLAGCALAGFHKTVETKTLLQADTLNKSNTGAQLR